jgi:hypothetical protein
VIIIKATLDEINYHKRTISGLYIFTPFLIFKVFTEAGCDGAHTADELNSSCV